MFFPLLFVLIGIFEIPIIVSAHSIGRSARHDCHKFSCIDMKGIPETPIQLYKYLLRQIPKLPAESQSYYRNYVKGVRNSDRIPLVTRSHFCRIFVRMPMKPIVSVSMR